MGGLHQMPRLGSSCVITSNQMKMPLKLRMCRNWECKPKSAYMQHMVTQGQTSRWKWRESDRCPQISKYWQYIWMNDSIFHLSSIPVYKYPKWKLSWWVPWLGNNRHYKLPKIMACRTVNVSISVLESWHIPMPLLAATELSVQGPIVDHLQLLVLCVKPAIWLALNMCLVNGMKWLTMQW